MKCPNCHELQQEIDRLKKENAYMSKALSGYVSRPHSNTDLIMGAALSGGDALGLAKSLIREPKKK